MIYLIEDNELEDNELVNKRLNEALKDIVQEPYHPLHSCERGEDCEFKASLALFDKYDITRVFIKEINPLRDNVMRFFLDNYMKKEPKVSK